MPTTTTSNSNSERQGAFSARAAADYLDTTVGTLAKWRCHGEGPPYVKLGRKVVYRRETLDFYLRGLEVSPRRIR